MPDFSRAPLGQPQPPGGQRAGQQHPPVPRCLLPVGQGPVGWRPWGRAVLRAVASRGQSCPGTAGAALTCPAPAWVVPGHVAAAAQPPWGLAPVPPGSCWPHKGQILVAGLALVGYDEREAAGSWERWQNLLGSPASSGDEQQGQDPPWDHKGRGGAACGAGPPPRGRLLLLGEAAQVGPGKERGRNGNPANRSFIVGPSPNLCFDSSRPCPGLGRGG